MYIRLLGFFALLFFVKSFVACSPAQDLRPVKKAKNIAEVGVNQAQTRSVEADSFDKRLEIEKKVFNQMNTLYSEAWFVISRSRFSHPKNIFEMTSQSLQKLNDAESSPCGLFVQRNKGENVLTEKKCNTDLKIPRIQWRWETEKEILVWFTYGQISAMVPVGVLEFKAYSPECKIQIDEEGSVQSFQCKDLGQAFNDKIQSFVFEKLQFQRSSSAVMEIVGKSIDLDGEILKYESMVPAVGEIDVKLTDLRPKKEEVKKPVEVVAPPPPAAPVAVEPTVSVTAEPAVPVAEEPAAEVSKEPLTVPDLGER